MGGRLGGRGWVRGTLAAFAALWLSACDRWTCDFYSHGACVEFLRQPGDMADAQRRMDRLLDLELPYWGLSSLDGWRIQYRESADYTCYMVERNEGCTDYPKQTLSVRLPPGAPDCFEAAELLHELGHYDLGDPMHSNATWEGVDAQFAGIVWNRPDADPSCVSRYRGIVAGAWIVRRNSF